MPDIFYAALQKRASLGHSAIGAGAGGLLGAGIGYMGTSRREGESEDVYESRRRANAVGLGGLGLVAGGAAGYFHGRPAPAAAAPSAPAAGAPAPSAPAPSAPAPSRQRSFGRRALIGTGIAGTALGAGYYGPDVREFLPGMGG